MAMRTPISAPGPHVARGILGLAMDPKEIVHTDPEILGGTPVFVGSRVPVDALIDFLESGETIEDFIENYPGVSREQIFAFLGRGESGTRREDCVRRVLFDENLPRLLRRKLPELDIRTAQEEGWGSFGNGESPSPCLTRSPRQPLCACRTVQRLVLNQC